MFHADLHVHSRFSRACSKSCDLPTLAWWAARKGITVVGTGDFTHPAWAAELSETLVPAEPGLLRLPDGEQTRLRRSLPPSCGQEVRFLLSAEISTIYRYGETTRKVHHLLYAPTLGAARAITDALSKAGNLASDGRPILGLDSRHLLDITLSAGPGCFLVPAHIWTPWFAVLGSKSGFDTVAECYRDLADHIFAVETGLSSDPAMNWMCSSLDGYRLVSNSDAHSPPMLGREATTFSTSLDYFAMAQALRTGEGLAGTLNFFPEQGRYHLDGHRKCGVRFEPAETKTHGGICPRCGKPLTIGVLHRVAELADRPAGQRPAGAPAAANMVSLPEIVAEILGTGPKSKKVLTEVDRLTAALGPELRILTETEIADISRAGGSPLGEAVARLRRGEVIKEGGYDGEYGVIRLFSPGELGGRAALFDVPTPAALFDVPAPAAPFDVPAPAQEISPERAVPPAPSSRPPSGTTTGRPPGLPAASSEPSTGEPTAPIAGQAGAPGHGALTEARGGSGRGSEQGGSGHDKARAGGDLNPKGPVSAQVAGMPASSRAPDQPGPAGAPAPAPTRAHDQPGPAGPAVSAPTRAHDQPGAAGPAAPPPSPTHDQPRLAGPMVPGPSPAHDQPGAAGSGVPAVHADIERLLAGLDADQRAAALAPGPLLIVAGPGTGKTATLTHRIAAQAAARGLPHAACLALTFTRRAAAELGERLGRLTGGGPPATVTTFHGLGLMILRERGDLAGLPPGFGVADDAGRLAVATELAGSQPKARRLLNAAARDPDRRAEFAAALTARGLVDFDGLVEMPAALLRAHPAIAAALRQRWPMISVDEYQDIDASQYALLRLLAPDGAGLTVIGDPDQAIYGFRGADVGFFLRFGADYPGATVARLTRNYRSTPAIVTSALQAVAPATLVPGRALRAVAAHGRTPARVTVHEAADEHAEAAWIAQAIDRLLGGASFHSLDTGRADGHAGGRLGLADIAVLYRTDAQAGVLGQALTRAGLPFQKRSHDLLTRRAAVPELIHAMRTAVPAPRRPATEAAVTAGIPSGPAGPDAPEPGEWAGDGPPPAGSVAAVLAAAVRTLAARAPAGRAPAVDVLAAAEVLMPLARRCGTDFGRFFTEITLGAEVDALDPRAAAVTLLTLHAAKGLEFEAVFLAGCERGLLPLWLPGGGKRPATAPGSPQPAAATGFGTAGAAAGQRTAGPGGQDDGEAEERRLLFVGMTRARTHLFLTCAARRRRHGTVRDAGLSPLLAAVDPALLDRSGPAQPRPPAPRQLRLL